MQTSFLDVLADFPPDESALLLAKALGEVIRATTDDRHARREAVDALLIIVERSAGLRF